MLLFLTGETNDAAVQWMTMECEQRGIEWLCLCTQHFPQDIVLTALPNEPLLQGRIQVQGREVQLTNFTGVWHYLPGAVQPDPDLDDISQQLVQRESRETLSGLYRSLEDRIWVNVPHCERQARHRIFQLRLATQIGLKIPKTLIGNDPTKVLAFVEECGGQVVYKPLSSLVTFDNEGTPDGIGYVTLLTKEDVEKHIDSLRIAPCVFQEVIRKKLDITLYVIGEYVWAAAVTPPSDGNGDENNLDYRRNGLWSQEYTPIVLPPQVERACVQLTQHLGLRMCNLDLILTPDGEYLFLDANPTDLWVGIEHFVGFPLCTALVDVLSGTHTLANHPYLCDRSPVFRPSAYSSLIPKDTRD